MQITHAPVPAFWARKTCSDFVQPMESHIQSVHVQLNEPESWIFWQKALKEAAKQTIFRKS